MENKGLLILIIIIMVAGFMGLYIHMDGEFDKLYANDQLIATKTVNNEQAIIQVGLATGVIQQEQLQQGEQLNGEQNTE